MAIFEESLEFKNFFLEKTSKIHLIEVIPHAQNISIRFYGNFLVIIFTPIPEKSPDSFCCLSLSQPHSLGLAWGLGKTMIGTQIPPPPFNTHRVFLTQDLFQSAFLATCGSSGALKKAKFFKELNFLGFVATF